MILAVARVRVPPNRQEDVVNAMKRVLEPIRTEPGCLGIQCGRDIEDDNTLVIVERWASAKDMGSHIQSERYRIILSVLESASEDPEVQFHKVSETSGMEVIFESRGRATRKE
jgi:quinol monooxygenase YgiN